ncbi:TPA: hypothetical protein NJ548_003675 [Vibrio parahaemolyticus]|uniref:hypothetical protein n=1 Tax=Vibrio diabolicus TaxID=50719 RepID=UPI00281037C7|nr:hypothetical protein [Vibrio parahaemolyticus]HCG8418316.1 hypothetical protein [Vibrio parahaemolyticus]HDU8578962.1 hypothetical protein [Vibrio diabolicus]
MIASLQFEGDSQADLEVQNQMYGGCLQIIHANILERLNACKTQEYENLYCELSLLSDFDHRPWQFFYDCIADVARYEKVNRFKNRCESWSFEDWLEEFSLIVYEIFNSVPKLADQLAVAILYPNPSPKGIAAEDFIELTITSEYRSTLQKLDGYQTLLSADTRELLH